MSKISGIFFRIIRSSFAPRAATIRTEITPPRPAVHSIPSTWTPVISAAFSTDASTAPRIGEPPNSLAALYPTIIGRIVNTEYAIADKIFPKSASFNSGKNT